MLFMKPHISKMFAIKAATQQKQSLSPEKKRDTSKGDTPEKPENGSSSKNTPPSNEQNSELPSPALSSIKKTPMSSFVSVPEMLPKSKESQNSMRKVKIEQRCKDIDKLLFVEPK